MRVHPEPWGGSGPEVTGPAGEPGVKEGAYMAGIPGCYGRGTCTGLSVVSGPCCVATKHPGRAAAPRLLSTAPGVSLASLPHISPGQSGFRVERSAII